MRQRWHIRAARIAFPSLMSERLVTIFRGFRRFRKQDNYTAAAPQDNISGKGEVCITRRTRATGVGRVLKRAGHVRRLCLRGLGGRSGRGPGMVGR
jgi:hypothetical protein